MAGRVVDAGAAFALVEAECGQIDQRGDVVQAGRGLGDDRTAVGMPDQHRRRAECTDERCDGRGVEGEAAQGVRRRDNGVAGALQFADYAAEAGRVRERTVNKDHGRCRSGGHAHELPSVGGHLFRSAVRSGLLHHPR
jgi:hypothetical protein